MDLIRNVYTEAFKLAYCGYCYKEIREKFKEFNSIIIANARYDAIHFRKAVLKIHRYPKKLNPQIFLRKNDYKFINENEAEIIYKPKNRLRIKVFPTEKQLKMLKETKQKGARIVNKDDKWFFDVYVEKEVELPNPKECKTIIGVDIGINNIAVAVAYYNGKFMKPIFFKGGLWKHITERMMKVSTYSKSYKRLARRRLEILHIVSKRIVEYAKQFEKPVIVLEKIKIKNGDKGGNKINFLLNNWARKKFQKMIEYKALWNGIPVVYVNAKNTSKICHYCGNKGVRKGKIFKCLSCGREYNADLNASMNLVIKYRQSLDEPKAMTGGRSSTGISPVEEGETCLPSQTHTQPRNGSQMNRMKVKLTVRLPIGGGSWRNGGDCFHI